MGNSLKLPNEFVKAAMQDLAIGGEELIGVEAMDLRQASDHQIEAMLESAKGQGLVANTDVLACWAGAEALLGMLDCRRCGDCCEGTIFKEPTVCLMPGEPRRIADFLGWSAKRVREFCSHKDGILHLNLSCPFYSDHRCSIYQVRPLGCQLYPIHGSIVTNDNGGNQAPTLVVDIDCPAGTELV